MPAGAKSRVLRAASGLLTLRLAGRVLSASSWWSLDGAVPALFVASAYVTGAW